MPRALITGLTGQDGTILAGELLERGWEVHGVVRPASVSPIFPEVVIHQADFADPGSFADLVEISEPEVIFNLAGLSSVAASWDQPVLSAMVNAVSAVSLLDAAWRRSDRVGSEIRFVQASSSEIFGDSTEQPQTENTQLDPSSPYGSAKAFSHSMVQIYRARGMFASNAILYNHESILRPRSFVTRKITAGAAAISLGLESVLSLGNLEIQRDWGWAPDYVSAMISMAEANDPADFVIATGISHSIKDFVTAAFSACGMEDWEPYVKIDAQFLRPADAEERLGDASAIGSKLGWKPSVEFDHMVQLMVEHDLSDLRAAR